MFQLSFRQNPISCYAELKLSLNIIANKECIIYITLFHTLKHYRMANVPKKTVLITGCSTGGIG